MKTRKRFLSLLLGGAMLFSLWPQTALAEGAQGSGTQGAFVSEEYDAQKSTGTGEGFPPAKIRRRIRPLCSGRRSRR